MPPGRSPEPVRRVKFDAGRDREHPYPAEAGTAPAQKALKDGGTDEEITAKQIDGEKKIKGQGMSKGSGKDSGGGKGKATGRTKEFTPWWKKIGRSRGKGFEKGGKRKGK